MYNTRPDPNYSIRRATTQPSTNTHQSYSTRTQSAPSHGEYHVLPGTSQGTRPLPRAFSHPVDQAVDPSNPFAQQQYDQFHDQGHGPHGYSQHAVPLPNTHAGHYQQWAPGPVPSIYEYEESRTQYPPSSEPYVFLTANQYTHTPPPYHAPPTGYIGSTSNSQRPYYQYSARTDRSPPPAQPYPPASDTTDIEKTPIPLYWEPDESDSESNTTSTDPKLIIYNPKDTETIRGFRAAIRHDGNPIISAFNDCKLGRVQSRYIPHYVWALVEYGPYKIYKKVDGKQARSKKETKGGRGVIIVRKHTQTGTEETKSFREPRVQQMYRFFLDLSKAGERGVSLTEPSVLGQPRAEEVASLACPSGEIWGSSRDPLILFNGHYGCTEGVWSAYIHMKRDCDAASKSKAK